MDEFGKSCFGHFLSFNVDAVFSSLLVHNIFDKEIVEEGVFQYDIWFGIGQCKFRFPNEEFCLVISLKFGRSSIIGTDGAV